MARFIVCIPTFNEVDNISDLIDQLLDINLDLTVAIIDDNSRDGTANAVREKIRQHGSESVWLIERETKDGRGGAVLRGFREGLTQDFDFFVEMDGDFSHDPADLQGASWLIDSSVELLIGARYPDGQIHGWPLKRRILSYFANRLASLLIPADISDYTNGFRIYSRTAVEKILSVGVVNKGFIALSEIIAICVANDLSISSFPIIFRDRTKGSSNASIAEVIKSFVAVFKIALMLRKGKFKA